MGKILIVDDEPGIVESFVMVLEDTGYEIDFCLDGFTALEKIKSTEYDIVFLDIKMPKMDGIEVLEKAIEINNDLVVVMISGHGTVETAVESTKKGAYDFLEKPFGLVELNLKFQNALKLKKSRDEIKKYREELLQSNDFSGDSSVISDVREKIEKYANLDLNVLITGESGTGKMLAAKLIHLKSFRSDKPFVKVNCARLNKDNIETELFGKIENNKLISRGKLFEAEDGTVLFDEIANLSPDSQTIIFKVIEEKKFIRAGESKELIINARFVFTTNQDIESMIENNMFRSEFYHRINVLNINIPPLRNRTEDVPVLIKLFSNQICRSNNINEKNFSDSAVEILKTLRYPGNVRELRNMIERLIFTINKDTIDSDDIDIPESRHTRTFSELFNKNMSLNEFQNESEKLFLTKMLNDYDYNISRTADALKIQRSHMYKLINKYDIPKSPKISPDKI
jgi:DNA-binding NtrC family response regulator